MLNEACFLHFFPSIPSPPGEIAVPSVNYVSISTSQRQSITVRSSSSRQPLQPSIDRWPTDLTKIVERFFDIFHTISLFLL